MPGKTLIEVLEIARDQHGFVRAADLREAGIDPKRLGDYHRRGIADHKDYGLYRLNLFPPGEMDEFMEAALWPDGRGCLSHQTALDLWDLCDVNPDHIDLTVPRSYRTNRKIPQHYRLHRQDLENRDRTYLDGLPIVTPALAIQQALDVGLRPSLIEQAVETAKREALITGSESRRFEDLLRRIHVAV
jgi:predicted transcriptional regulator of viral defense system